jgi:hypothetical protein
MAMMGASSRIARTTIMMAVSGLKPSRMVESTTRNMMSMVRATR